MGDKWTDWHNAIFGALKLEFLEYKDALEFTSEYKLTSAPLRIDVLIVKKIKDIVIEKNIGRIFRNDNIIEYKSPKDNFRIIDFNKTFAYCYGYASKKEMSITDISLTILLSMEPKIVFRHIKDVYRWDIDEDIPGFYVVSGAGMAFPIQFIVTKKLSVSENLWLNTLRENAPRESIEKVLDELKNVENIEKATLAAYIYVLASANDRTIEEIRKMEDSRFDALMERTGLAAKWEQRGREQERQQWQAETQQWQAEKADLLRQLQETQQRTVNNGR
jgi:hypothetical protein